MAAENGISKLRINPGNIGGEANVRMLADCARMHRIPIRIGVNSGSIEKDILEDVYKRQDFRPATCQNDKKRLQ